MNIFAQKIFIELVQGTFQTCLSLCYVLFTGDKGEPCVQCLFSGPTNGPPGPPGKHGAPGEPGKKKLISELIRLV